VGLMYVNPSQNEGTLGVGAKVDLGFLGPNVRVVPRVGYWKADVESSQVNELEAQLEVASGLSPGSINLGTIERSAYIFGTDFQWTSPTAMIAPYVGIGLDVYILNDDGDAIKNTFLDDLVVTAGVSGVAGVEVALSPAWAAYGEFRGAAVTDASNLGVAVGILLMTGI
ncbi:MAG: outer membrane beta-barrel protein, partial [Gemmatimonadota bacterium]|nr:outer membrane beta-barrel protein [Gemmatimonadota bacterium]